MSKKSIYQHLGEAHYLYNQIRWTVTQIGWWYYKVEPPKTIGEKWMLFGKWMDSQYPGHEKYMNTGGILKDVVKNDYLCKLYKHIVTMRGLFTHFFCDADLFSQITKQEYDPNWGIEGLPIISCGKSGQPEEINELFIFTFNYYCLKFYNILADYIRDNMNKSFDDFRFNLSLTQNNITRHLHPRWDFDRNYKQQN